MGGFTSGTSSYEEDAVREFAEESGGCTVSSLEYVTSCVIDDWRYRSENTKIVTAFYTGEFDSGVPTPTDDMEGGMLVWVELKELMSPNAQIMEAHVPLVDALINKLGDKS